MIKITVIALAGIKEKYFKDASAEYEKRLSRYCNLDIIEIEPVRLPEKPSETEIETALLRESEAIFKKIPKNSKIISMCVEGKAFSSEQLAQSVQEACDFGSNITFIIGSSYGLSEKVKQKSDLKLSLSKMTFPHRLFRVMLLEQIYRAFKINEGGTYHK